MYNYVIRKITNPGDRTQAAYYAQTAPGNAATLAQIVKRIEKRSTVSSADVKAVLDALQYEVIETLAAGDSVRLGDLGSFHTTLRSAAADTAAAAKSAGSGLIQKVNVHFTPSTAMKQALDPATLDFAQQADVANATDD